MEEMDNKGWLWMQRELVVLLANFLVFQVGLGYPQRQIGDAVYLVLGTCSVV
jgi:hypothetical protein